jgi:hypothetical protein
MPELGKEADIICPLRNSSTIDLEHREVADSGINVYASDTREMCET